MASYDLDNLDGARIDSLGRLPVHQLGAPTFRAIAENVAVANNKSMISIVNTSTKIVRLIEINLVNTRTAATTGVAGIFQVRRITGHSAGTSITANPHDTNDTLDGGVTVRTGATVSGEDVVLSRRVWSTDEWGAGTLDKEGLDSAFQSLFPQWNNARGIKPFTLRQNQGLHIKFATNSANGSFDMEFVFIQEDA